jgi:hypothetical protein
VRRASASFVATTVACVLVATAARADTSSDCAAAAEEAQPLQHDGKLRAARARLSACSQPQCPALVRSDCTRWLADLEASTPSIVVHATDRGGADLVDVQVVVDGELVVSRLDGRDIPIDPGAHVVRFEHARSAPIEEHIVADVGVQHRILSVTFAAAGSTSASTSAGPPSTTGTSPIGEQTPTVGSRTHRSVVLPLTLGGVGLVSAAVGGFAWGQGLSQCRSSIEHSAPACTTDQLSGAHASLVAGDVLVIGGVALAAAGLILWLVQGSDAPPAAIAAATGGLLYF